MRRHWHRFSLSQLDFPYHCAKCCKVADTTFVVHARRHWLARAWEIAAGDEEYLSVELPYCSRCKAARIRRERLAIGVGVLVGIVLALLVWGVVSPENPQRTIWIGLLLLFTPGVSHWLGRERGPVWLRNYSASCEALSLAFANAKFEKETLELSAE